MTDVNDEYEDYKAEQLLEAFQCEIAKSLLELLDVHGPVALRIALQRMIKKEI